MYLTKMLTCRFVFEPSWTFGMSLLRQVSCHIVHCYAVASQFEKCREKIAEMQIIVQELCRLLYYKVSLMLFLLFLNHLFINFTIIQNYNNDWRYDQQDMSPMWRPTWYNTISRHALKCLWHEISPQRFMVAL
jgi:hypothetical protein